jgi:RimJ/RimL family protein N-acetyltransferase
MHLRTSRLRLVAMTPELGRAETDRGALARALGAEIPDGWPPPEMHQALGVWSDALAERPELAGWVNWYWLRTAPGSEVLVGYGGFKGPPGTDGVVELGYAVLDDHQRRGYATDAIAALLEWAWQEPRVARIDAETRHELRPSVQLLAKLGFRPLPQTDPEVLRYGLDRPAGR